MRNTKNTEESYFISHWKQLFGMLFFDYQYNWNNYKMKSFYPTSTQSNKCI